VNLKLLTALLALTLVLNVILGFELYEALHPSPVSSVMPSSSTHLYSFSFKTKFHFHVKETGEYKVELKVKEGVFNQLYVILYFKDGESVTLSLNNTVANVEFEHKEEEVIAYVSGTAYSNMTEQEILNNIKICLLES
jgi:hypothetical protein